MIDCPFPQQHPYPAQLAPTDITRLFRRLLPRQQTGIDAVRHAWGPSVRVVVDRPADDRVYVAVIDRSPHQLPEPRTPEPDEQSGRGLLLIETLSDRWGYDRLGPASRPWGKRCWAELRVKDGE